MGLEFAFTILLGINLHCSSIQEIDRRFDCYEGAYETYKELLDIIPYESDIVPYKDRCNQVFVKWKVIMSNCEDKLNV